MDVDRERLRNEYRAYDRRVDIVSSVEVWFTRVTEIKPTVAWFERYPSLKHPLDGNDAKPDFTVLFADGTGYVGELSDLALHDQSLDALCSQLARYDTLDRLPAGPPLPGGVQPTSPVTASITCCSFATRMPPVPTGDCATQPATHSIRSRCSTR
jgi:hypothetical protein